MRRHERARMLAQRALAAAKMASALATPPSETQPNPARLFANSPELGNPQSRPNRNTNRLLIDGRGRSRFLPEPQLARREAARSDIAPTSRRRRRRRRRARKCHRKQDAMFQSVSQSVCLSVVLVSWQLIVLERQPFSRSVRD